MNISGNLGSVFVIAMAVLLGSSLQAQQPKQRQVDVEPTSAGDLKITPIVHASLLLEWGGKAIYIDPTSQGDYTGLPKADFILITHTHGDHLDVKAIATLRKEGDGTIILAPEAATKTLSDAKSIAGGIRTTLAVGQTSIAVEAVPAYNLKHARASGQPYHPKGEGVGYVLTLGGKRVYIAGDTECVPEIKELRNIDIAFLCMNLPYTQSAQEGAECVKSFRPKVIYPYHYSGQDMQILVDALKGEQGIELRLRNWY